MSQKAVKKEVLSKAITDLIDKFAKQELELNAKGKTKWAKASLKKLDGVKLVKNDEGLHLNFNDGSQRFGYNVKDANGYGIMKRQMLANFVNNVEYLDSLAKYVFNSESTSSDTINSI